MLEVIRAFGSGAFKAAGGVKDTQTAANYLAIADEVMGEGWAQPATFRFGASGLLGDLHAILGGEAPPKIASGY